MNNVSATIERSLASSSTLPATCAGIVKRGGGALLGGAGKAHIEAVSGLGVDRNELRHESTLQSCD